MKIFVTGASGYIGYAVAHALARAGHEVYGLVRSQERAQLLLGIEVEPVVGDLGQPTAPAFAAAARRCQVLVHCATEHSQRRWEVEFSTIHHLVQAAAEAKRPRLLIYTSGVWIYGPTWGETGRQGGAGEAADEASAINPLPLVQPRVQIEDQVLRAGGGMLRSLVIRPGCVYGGGGGPGVGLTGAWFESALREGAARVIGDGHFRWAMVHVTDLADLYVRAAESGLGAGGEVLNATDGNRFTVLECARAASQAAGAGGRVRCVPVAEAQEQMGEVAQCLAMDQHVDSGKAARLLGWRPRHPGFVDGVARYFGAWGAYAARGRRA